MSTFNVVKTAYVMHVAWESDFIKTLYCFLKIIIVNIFVDANKK